MVEEEENGIVKEAMYVCNARMLLFIFGISIHFVTININTSYKCTYTLKKISLSFNV